MSRPYAAALAVFALMLAALAAACGSGGDDTATASLDCCEPPAAYAVAGDERVEMRTGAFEWGDCSDPEPQECVVADAFEVSTPDEPLPVGAGESIQVANPVPGAEITRTGIRAWPVADLVPTPHPEAGALVWPFGPGVQPGSVQQDDEGITFAAPNEPGRYVVNVYFSYGPSSPFQQAPNVYYGLLLDVR